MPLDFSLGGSGFVYILPEEMKNNYPVLSFKSIFPTIYEAKKNYDENHVGE